MNQIDHLLRYPETIDRLCCIFFFGRSGSFLLGSAIDGHPDVLMLPPGTMEYFANATTFLKRLSFKDVDDVIAFTLSSFPGIIRSLEPDRGEHFVAKLQAALTSAVERNVKLSWRVLFFAVHVAYAAALGRHVRSRRPMVVWNAHILTPLMQKVISSVFPEAISILCVRHPSKTIDSYFHHYRHNPIFDPPDQMPYASLQRCFNALQYLPGGPAAAVRFEDMHIATEDTMRAVADWLGIDWDSALLAATWNGEISWSTTGSGQEVTGFSTKRANDRCLHHVSGLDAVRMRRVFDSEYTAWHYLPAAASAGAMLFLPWRIQWQIYRATLVAELSAGVSGILGSCVGFARALAGFPRAVLSERRRLGEALASFPEIASIAHEGAANVIVLLPGFPPAARAILKALNRRKDVVSLPWTVSNALFDRLVKVSLAKADSVEGLTARLATVMDADPTDSTGPVFTAVGREIAKIVKSGRSLSIAALVRCMAMAHAKASGKNVDGPATTLVLASDSADSIFPDARFIACTADPLSMVGVRNPGSWGSNDPIQTPRLAAEYARSLVRHSAAVTINAEDIARRPDEVAAVLGFDRFTEAEVAIVRKTLDGAPRHASVLLVRAALAQMRHDVRTLGSGVVTGVDRLCFGPFRATARLVVETVRIAAMMRDHRRFRAEGHQPPPLLGSGVPR